MRQRGSIVLFRFPQTDLAEGKLRPALLVADLPSEFDDSLICMISSQAQRFIPNFDEIIKQGDDDFQLSGLKCPSVIHIGRLAVVENNLLIGEIGKISSGRYHRITRHLAEWLLHT